MKPKIPKGWRIPNGWRMVEASEKVNKGDRFTYSDFKYHDGCLVSEVGCIRIGVTPAQSRKEYKAIGGRAFTAIIIRPIAKKGGTRK